MSIIVQKYGGSSLASSSQIRQVAKLIAERQKTGGQLCIVVSAMGKKTNELLGLAHEITKHPSRRELDMLLSCGERISMALLAMALNELNVPSVSLTGSQSGIITNDVHSGACIIEVRPERVLEGLKQNKVVIVAGFQGVSRQKEITTLGRGGSDATAVALTAALGAEACEIYSDVDGIYSADPRVVDDVRHIGEISHDEMLALSHSGAKVLNSQAIEWAKFKGIEIRARKTGDLSRQTRIIPENQDQKPLIKAITAQKRLFCFSFECPSSLLKLIEALKELHICPSQLLGSPDGYCLIAPEDAHGLERLNLDQLKGIRRLPDCSSLSIIGNNISLHMETTHQIVSELRSLGVRILGITNSKSRLYFIIESNYIHETVRHLHQGVLLK